MSKKLPKVANPIRRVRPDHIDRTTTINRTLAPLGGEIAPSGPFDRS